MYSHTILGMPLRGQVTFLTMNNFSVCLTGEMSLVEVWIVIFLSAIFSGIVASILDWVLIYNRDLLQRYIYVCTWASGSYNHGTKHYVFQFTLLPYSKICVNETKDEGFELYPSQIISTPSAFIIIWKVPFIFCRILHVNQSINFKFKHNCREKRSLGSIYETYGKNPHSVIKSVANCKAISWYWVKLGYIYTLWCTHTCRHAHAHNMLTHTHTHTHRGQVVWKITSLKWLWPR